MHSRYSGETTAPARHIDSKYASLLIAAIMAIVMSTVMSLFRTIVRLEFARNLVPVWLTSFALGGVVAASTAILVAPHAQQLVARAFPAPRRSSPDDHLQAAPLDRTGPAVLDSDGVHQAATQPTSDAAARDRQPWSVLLLLVVAQFMVIVDMTVVNVALPTIGAALHFGSPADLQWVVTAYVLFSGGLLLLGGRTADLLGRRRVFLVGRVTFATASLASGFAPSPVALVVFRAAQGLGAALLTPGALSIITTTYTGAQRATALALWGAITGAGAAAGVLMGGVLTSFSGWQWVFFINVPVGFVAATLALRLVAADPARIGRLRDLDLAGALAVIAGLVYTLGGTATYGWGSGRTLVSLALTAGLLGGFVLVERHAQQPLIPPAIWRVRSLVAGAGLMVGVTGIMGGAFFLNSLYLQGVLGATALEAGLAFFPFAVVITAASHVGSRLFAHVSTRSLLVLGLAATAGGLLLLARAPDQASYVADVLPGFSALGSGLGLAFVAIAVTAMADVSADQAGLASGLMMTGHELGGRPRRRLAFGCCQRGRRPEWIHHRLRGGAAGRGARGRRPHAALPAGSTGSGRRRDRSRRSARQLRRPRSASPPARAVGRVHR
jgi:EmrB/QacA subfamily drug resistance transporter